MSPGAAQRRVRHMKDLSGEAYLLTGLHPDGDDTISRLISALEQGIERTPDPEAARGVREVPARGGPGGGRH